MTENRSFFDIIQPRTDTTDRVYDLCVQIENILHSYDDKFDAFAELVQNSVDAILERYQDDSSFSPRIDIVVDYRSNKLSILDNGCGVQRSDLYDVLRPNCSLKRRLRQSDARGEKGAAVAFLQFGHRQFEFHSKISSERSQYVLKDGNRWFDEVSEKLSSPTWDESDLKSPTFEIKDTVIESLEKLDSGSYAVVEFSESSNLGSIPQMVFR